MSVRDESPPHFHHHKRRLRLLYCHIGYLKQTVRSPYGHHFTDYNISRLSVCTHFHTDWWFLGVLEVLCNARRWWSDTETSQWALCVYLFLVVGCSEIIPAAIMVVLLLQMVKHIMKMSWKNWPLHLQAVLFRINCSSLMYASIVFLSFLVLSYRHKFLQTPWL